MSQVPFTIPIESIDFKELKKRAKERRLRLQFRGPTAAEVQAAPPNTGIRPPQADIVPQRRPGFISDIPLPGGAGDIGSLLQGLEIAGRPAALLAGEAFKPRGAKFESIRDILTSQESKPPLERAVQEAIFDPLNIVGAPAARPAIKGIGTGAKKVIGGILDATTPIAKAAGLSEQGVVRASDNPGLLIPKPEAVPDPSLAREVGDKVSRALKQAESFRTIDAPGFIGGAIDKIPGLSHIQRYLRPANKLPPKIQNAWVASGGERAAFLTDQFPSRSRIFQQIDDLFGARATERITPGVSTQETLRLASAAVQRETGATQGKGILRFFQKQNPALQGVTIRGLEETLQSGPLLDNGVSKIVFRDGKFIANESSIHLTKDASAITIRHEIEHMLDAVRGVELDPSNPTFSRFTHSDFPAEFTRSQPGRRVRGPSPVEGGTTNTRFIGPESERVGIEGTILDIAQRPQFYDLTDEMRAFLAGWQTRQSGFQQELIQGYGARVKEFTVPEGSVFLSNVDRGTEMLAIMRQTEEQAIRQGRGAIRVFETAADRMKVNPDFNPVTDIRKLMSGMDEYRSTVAGNEVFRQGIGGKTLVEVVTEKHPDLLKLKTNLTRRINNLKSRLNTAESQITSVGGEVTRVSQSLDRATRRAEPLLNRVEELGQEWGPELSTLSGQVRELLQQAANLERRGGVLTERGIGALERRSTILTEISELSPQLDQVRRRYAAADLRPFQFVQEGVFRYLPADEAQSVRELSVFNTNHWVSFLDNMRGGIFAGDLSPIAGVQLPLSFLFQPHRAVSRLVGAGKSSIQSRDLLNVFRESTMLKAVEANPQLARDFAFFSGFPVETGVPREFAGGFLRFIPGFKVANERMYSVVLRQSFDLFDNMTQRLAGAGVIGDEAKVVAADMATKVFPMWNPARLGLSQSRAATIRALPTSVSFILQPAALVGEATTGFAKIALKQTLTAQEKTAVQLMTTIAGSVMSLSTATAAADALLRGNDPIDAMKEVIDPTSGKFASIFLVGTGRRLPLGGPFRGIIKAITPREVDWAPVPIPFANIGNFFLNRLNPFLGTQIKQLRNKDFFGGEIRKGELPEQILRGLLFEIEGSIPLVGGTVVGGLRRGLGIGDILEETGGQALGVNLGQETPFQQRDLAVQRWAQDNGIERGQVFQLTINGETVEVDQSQKIESFYDLVPSDRQRFEGENPGTVEAIKKETKRRADQGIEFAVRRQRAEDLKDASQTDQLADDDLLTNNDISPTEWRSKRRDRRLELNAKRGEVYTDLDTREPKTVIDYYFAEFDRIKTKFNNVMTDDAWQELEFWIESQPSEAQQFIDANTGLAPMTPKEQEYKADLATLHPYFDIRDFVIRSLLEDSLAKQYQEWLDAGPSDRAAIQRRNPAMGRIESRLVSGLQDLLRIKNPEIDRLVRKWEYSTSLPKNPTNLRELIGAR